jgi:hypothetical protein
LLFRAERGRAPPRGLAPTMGVVYPLHARALFTRMRERESIGSLHTASCVERHLKTVGLDP